MRRSKPVEKQMTEVVAARTEKKVTKYEDIRNEFEFFPIF